MVTRSRLLDTQMTLERSDHCQHHAGVVILTYS
jgi:hypothetical protein